jgi:pyrroline-5-carboxylate reductase
VRENHGVFLALELPKLLHQIDTEIYTDTYHRLISQFPMNSQPNEILYRLGFIGAGKLAGSIIRGLVQGQLCSPAEIIASEPNENVRAALRDEAGIELTTENAEVAEKADVIFIGVKPAVVLPVLREVASAIQNKLVISLAAGVRLKSIEEIANARFMRALTNTPSAICQAATALARGSRTTNEDVDLARQVFGAIGIVVGVTEEQIDAVTALSGSGPAFVYTVIEALAQGGKKCGLPAEAAMTLAAQTVLGAAQLALESKKSPEELIKMVVTPGGTTAAGLAAMEKHRTAEGLIAAIEAATKRAREMANENL